MYGHDASHVYIHTDMHVPEHCIYTHMSMERSMNLIELDIQQCTTTVHPVWNVLFHGCKRSQKKKKKTNKLFRSFKPEHNPPYSALNPNPWLIDGEWYQPQTDCLKAHTNVFGVCVYFLRYKIIIIIIIIIIKIAILCAVAILL